ncbi:TetR family transcriptional regulator [Streptomyces sp. NPDC101225]|uniref:TetR family transcriptional regulator n=1 Tax=Streptomyces sp. NPDC101225 TaxID=3366135 RepID=UPI0038100011
MADVRAAALSPFAENGYRATGVRDIADAPGIGPPACTAMSRARASCCGTSSPPDAGRRDRRPTGCHRPYSRPRRTATAYNRGAGALLPRSPS